MRCQTLQRDIDSLHLPSIVSILFTSNISCNNRQPYAVSKHTNGKFPNMGSFLKHILEMGLFSNYFLHGVIFYVKKYATRISHWRVWPSFDTYQGCRQCYWRFEVHWTRQFDWRVELGVLLYTVQGCKKRCRRRQLYQVETASATGELRCSWSCQQHQRVVVGVAITNGEFICFIQGRSFDILCAFF